MCFFPQIAQSSMQPSHTWGSTARLCNSQVVGETDDLIAVSKPASVPVHVCGQYRKNTVMALLEVERPDLGALHPVHRLDKPVSGLLLVAKNSAGANRVRAQIQVLLHVPNLAAPDTLGKCDQPMLTGHNMQQFLSLGALMSILCPHCCQPC